MWYTVWPLLCDATRAVPSPSMSTSPLRTSATAFSTLPLHSGNAAWALTAISATASRQRVFHVQQDRDALHARQHLPEELDPLPGECGDKGAEPCDIAAWLGQVGHNAEPKRFANRCHNDGKGSGSILGGECRRSPPGNQDVNLQTHQLGGERREPTGVTVSRAIFDDEVLPLNISEGTQTLSEGSEVGGVPC